ncbi:hypothetical protein [Amycolatopsis sp. BJA-103]|uniref:hypothetical protein n=1 Tax=Amycolatopsis sp. BJA-103 TaxID=1911175 RepID=UPI000C75DC47|nr:hypothetical protein [Amycolatopsis sp. BJA-103]AUI60643.1 hypothetical protein BKN51_22265 [Amycolatopsis sp. BJA-103]PNE16670.1 hypothetical protein B1H26_25915 [Amycolatopsis sp. BJA-103]
MAELTLDFPVLLGPVRVETRFVGDDLLVRIFPDEWSVDKFEDNLTRAELAALDAYWTTLWAVGDSPVGRRSAWQQLVGRVPAGRAGWLLGKHKPANPDDRPTGIPDGPVLVVVTPQAVAAQDRGPTVTYWTSVRKARGDRRKLREADIALLAAVGTARANAIRARRPSGVDSAPSNPVETVAVAFLVLTPPPEIAEESWTVAAKAKLLPDLFTVYGYVGDQRVFAVPGRPVQPDLAVSPDPGETGEDRLRVVEETGELVVPTALKWLVDFEAAKTAGMAVRIPAEVLPPGNIDRLVVLGLREQATPQESATAWGKLIGDQLRTPSGFGFLPQGTPTNNSEEVSAGQDPQAEAESGFATAAGFTAAAADWTTKTDGEWFAELLGLDPAVLAGVPNAEGTDRRDARAAHTALWPATWGHYLPALLNGVLTEEQIAKTRQFFLEHVSGRGPLPVVKIGRQPYGILPTTVFSELAFPETLPHRTALNTILKEAAKDWDAALAHVQYLDSAGGDPHQKLLDILALHPTSAEYHQRYAQSVEDLSRREELGASGLRAAVAAVGEPVREVLARFGYSAGEPDLARRVFAEEVRLLAAPVVDDRPLSEVDKIRKYAAEGNYLHWLAHYGANELETVRKELGFIDNLPPSALLYSLARHAVLLGAAEAARRLALLTPGAEAPDGRDAPFIHVDPSGGPSESRYHKLYSTDPAIDPERPVHEYLRTILDASPATAELSEQLKAVKALAELPTARLERVFAEHLDCTSYRLDAWRLGLVNERLAELRKDPAGGAPKRGTHLGAYGWLENVHRESAAETAPLPAGLPAIFGTEDLPHDEDNGGFVHAPSPAHARTAAILRAGFLANGKGRKDSTFAVNLSSERVRIALSLLDGMRQGQSPGALLGYRFERGLHDARAGLDKFIAGLRRKFPLRANKITDTKTTPGSIEQVEARNVIDGLALLRHVDREVEPLPKDQKVYPFDFTDLPEANGDEKTAIGVQLDALRNAHDALADLVVAEGAHQALQGNAERASATLDSYAKGGVLPEPSVVETPRSGTTLTHRFGLQFTPGLRPDHGAPLLGRNNPRARAEPAVNAWLRTVLPDAGSVAALVTWLDERGRPQSRVVSQAEAGLQAIDLLWAVPPARKAETTDLDDRILGVVVEKSRPRPDAALTIEYTERVEGKVSFFELSPLIGTLRSLLTTARPLRPTDLVPGAGSAQVDRRADDEVTVARERPVAVLDSLTRLGTEVTAFRTDLGELYPAQPNRAEILENIDDFLARYAKLARTAGDFGLVISGWGELSVWRGGVFATVLAAVAAVAERMKKALDTANVLFGEYERLPSSTSDAERFRLLEQIERLIVTKLGARERTPSLQRGRVRSNRIVFERRLGRLTDFAGTSEPTLSGLLDDVARQLPLTDIDPAGLDLKPFEDQVVAYGQELLTRAKKLEVDLIGEKGRKKTAEDLLVNVHDKAVTRPDRVAAAIDVLEVLLGEDVLVVPEFTPPEAVLEQWRDARADSVELVAHLTSRDPDVLERRDFPVDDWLHGMARVREKPRLWEKTVLLANALLDTGPLTWKEPALTPVQLPYVENDHWLAMEFFDPEKVGDQLDQDRLLFTAHYAASLNGKDHCGLLLDEWTEVIPAERETTGIALHYDRPDSEPPQAMLLVVPPVLDPEKSWTPELLVEAITETFQLAKTRAVEPDHLDGTPLSQLLPAAVLSAVRGDVTVGTDLAVADLRRKAMP